jgi:RNA polymerase sigma-70 factor, ECF subfamily
VQTTYRSVSYLGQDCLKATGGTIWVMACTVFRSAHRCGRRQRVLRCGPRLQLGGTVSALTLGRRAFGVRPTTMPGQGISSQAESTPNEPFSIELLATPDIWKDESELIARAKRDSREFGLLYERYMDRIYRYIYRRVGDHESAEDLTAQTFQQALAALPSYEWRGVPFSAWLYRIAGNLVIRHRRVNAREVCMEHVERIVDERHAFDDPLDAVLQQANNDQLYRALQRLSSDQRRALALKYSHGLKNHEVGAMMNRSEGGIKQLVHRAMIVLRQALSEVEVESGRQA